MSDVKWIKLYTDVVNHKKINRIRRMPEGNNIVLIWFFLLIQAGESNQNGGLFIADAIPFTVEDLAEEFKFSTDVINLALITLEKYKMIEIFEDVIYIKNWDEYQNVEGMDKIREQTRNRVAAYRERKKLLNEPDEGNEDVTQSNVTVTQQNKKKNKNKSIYSASDYEEVWKLYPNKKGKVAAMKKISNILNKISLEDLIGCVNRYIEETKNTDARYIMYGSTFFNGRYEDYLDENYQSEETVIEPIYDMGCKQ